MASVLNQNCTTFDIVNTSIAMHQCDQEINKQGMGVPKEGIQNDNGDTFKRALLS
jgi:hypothetical protein